MTKHYIFKDDSYWEKPPCSCCEDYLVESYNSEQTSSNLGSAMDESDCYLQSIATEKGWMSWRDIPYDFNEMSYNELVEEASKMGITVEIVE